MLKSWIEQNKLYIKNRDGKIVMIMIFMKCYCFLWYHIIYGYQPPLVLSFNQSYQIMIEMAAVIKHFVEVIVKQKQKQIHNWFKQHWANPFSRN